MFQKAIVFVLFLLPLTISWCRTAAISYVKDTANTFDFASIEQAPFVPYNEAINDGYSKAVYWIQIEQIASGDMIQIPNVHVTDVVAYQDGIRLDRMAQERFVTYALKSETPVFLRVAPKKESFVPVEIYTRNEFKVNERINFMFIGFYYGFVCILFAINLIYFFAFKEWLFVVYSAWLMLISFGLIMSDGLLYYFQVDQEYFNTIQAIDHFLVAVSAAVFVSIYLQVRNYYRLFDKSLVLFLGTMFAVMLVYLINRDFQWYMVLEVMVFSMFVYLWLVGVTLFRKNVFTKIFVFAYIFILILGIDFYILKLFGISGIGLNASGVKVGGFIEMTAISLMIGYRMKILKLENQQMEDAIRVYLEEIKTLSTELEKNSRGESNIFEAYDLSIREVEIMNLLAEGKSNKEISQALFISVNTVKFHVKNLYSKLKINSRKEVLMKAKEFSS